MIGASGFIRRKRVWFASAASFAVAAAANVAAAQTRDPPDGPAASSVSEVVVTAERRGVDIQRTPIAVTALSGQTLDQSFVTDITGLNALVPGLQTTKAAGFEGLVTVRGVGSGTPENSLVTSPGVSLFVDGVYIANTISINQALFDVQSIEVLRGPQGALYGQSSIGGAININTTQPKLNVYDASGDVSFGSYTLFRERGEVNLPLSDKVALRVSGQRFDHDGFTKNLSNGQDLDDAHNGSAKVSLLWQPRQDFSATFSAQYYNDDRNGDAQKNILDPTPDKRELRQDLPAQFNLTTQLYSVKLNWDLPWFTVRSTTAFQGLDHQQKLDSDRSIAAVIGGYDHIVAWNTHMHNYTEDFELISKPGRFEWIVGFFGLYQGSKQFVVEYGTVIAPDFSSFTAPPTTYPNDILTNKPSYLNYGNLSEVRRRSHSFFGQATYHVTDKFRITAGARSNNDYFRDISINAGAGGSVALAPIIYKTDVPTWRAVSEYDLTPNNMLYASYTRGYKPGGTNGSNLTIIPNTFKPETNNAYEVGVKNFLFDRTLRLNVSAFSYIHRNFQFIEPDVFPYNSGIVNVPRIHDYGLEIEAQYSPHDGRLKIGGNLALEKGEVSSTFFAVNSTTVSSLYGSGISGFPGVAGTPCAFGGAYYNPACYAALLALASNLKGNEPPANPNVSGAINASYRFDAYKGSLTPRIEVAYRGDEWARIFNQRSVDKMKSYAIVNANLDYVPSRGPWRVSLTATNLLDEAGVNARYTDPYGTFQTSEQYIPPRQIIGTIAVSF